MEPDTLDPYAQSGPTSGTLTGASGGGDLRLNADGTADVEFDQPNTVHETEHFANLAEVMDDIRLNAIATDLLDAIKVDKESREARDKQYDEGLRRTGLGNDAPGGAQFEGASRAVHPMLTEAAVDFAAGVMREMLPPDGPVRASIIGEDTDEKNERARRVSRYMNYQITELMPSTYHEFEMGFTQCPLGGAFYTKTYLNNDQPAVAFIPIDHVYRPWTDGDFYQCARITHRQTIDKWTFMENVRMGLWRDVVNVDETSNLPEETDSDQSNDRIVGREMPVQNVDAVREVYECSCLIALESDQDQLLPYLITMDVSSRKVLSIYRNWSEDDVNKRRLDFLVEWPFWPWRGGYPIGMTHMIGGLSAAATGALRALLDAAHLNNSQTGVQLKGGSTIGGQNVRPQQGQVATIQGSLAQDDIRKTFMPLPFNPPSPTLFNLLGFLVDAARGVVRTTFDEYDKFNGQTPVGTAQMFVEQGMKNFGAVHGRLHRSMRRFLKQLWEINARTVNDMVVMDDLGELTVSAADFQGPMCILPVSDPRIFSDMQRKAQAQTISQRATTLPQLYDIRKSETNFLRQMNVADPEQYFIKIPQPKKLNPAAENVTASEGLPLKVFPGQDHLSHIEVHMAYIKSPIFGQIKPLVIKMMPTMLGHLADHVSQWYADAMLEAATAAVRRITGDPTITLQSLEVEGAEAPLDRLLAQLSPEVMAIAEEELGELPAIIQEAQDLLDSYQPPQPMDPSAVAMQDVQRQKAQDKAKNELELHKIATNAEASERKDMLALRKQSADDEFRMDQLRESAENNQRKAMNDAANVAVRQDANEVRRETNTQDNLVALEIASDKIEAGEGTNLENGTGMDQDP